MPTIHKRSQRGNRVLPRPRLALPVDDRVVPRAPHAELRNALVVKHRLVRAARADEAEDGERELSASGHARSEGERLAVVGAAEEEDCGAPVHAEAGDTAVDENCDGAGGGGEDGLVEGAEGGVGGFHAAVDGAVLVERYDDEGGAEVLGDGGDVLVHCRVWGDGGEGADGDAGGVFFVGLECAGDGGGGGGVVVGCGGGCDEDGGRAGGELDEVEGDGGDGLALGGVGGVEEGEDGRDVARGMEAEDEAELGVRTAGLKGAALEGGWVAVRPER